MVQRIQLVITTEERYRQAIDRGLAEFERGSGKKERTGSAWCTLETAN